MARTSLDPPRTLLWRVAEWYSRRRYGTVLDAGRVYGHHPSMVAATRIGCPWCVDFGYGQAEDRRLSSQGFSDRCAVPLPGSRTQGAGDGSG